MGFTLTSFCHSGSLNVRSMSLETTMAHQC